MTASRCSSRELAMIPRRIDFLAFCLLSLSSFSSAIALQEARRDPSPPPSADATSAKRELVPGVPPSDGIPALVIDATTGEPVAGALVTWFEGREDFQPRMLPEPQLE